MKKKKGRKPKPINWDNVMVDYINGEPLSVIADRYHTQIASINYHAYRDGWRNTREQMKVVLKDGWSKKIDELADQALDKLKFLLDDETLSPALQLKAISLVMDISGMKNLNITTTGELKMSVAQQKVFVTAEERQKANDHIDEILSDTGLIECEYKEVADEQ